MEVEIKKIRAIERIAMPHNIVVAKGTEGELVITTGKSIVVNEVVFPVKQNDSIYLGRIATGLTPDLAKKITIIEKEAPLL